MQLKWPMRWDLFSLFPAYAGVIPEQETVSIVKESFPRIRGGDPHSDPLITRMYAFSPNTRG